MQKYNYGPLPPRSMRLVEVLGGHGSEVIRCQLRQVQAPIGNGAPFRSIFDLFRSCIKHPVEYEALSYVWGPPEPAEVIICNGQALEITANLASAVRHLRLSDRCRILWIDQICINQQDLIERSQQVLIMGDIYRNAKQVISWLGDDPDHHGPVMQNFLQQVVDAKFKDVGNHVYPESNEYLLQHNLPGLGAPEWTAVNAMLALPYFTRVWILQEVIMARQVTLKWGETQFSWDLLDQLINWQMRNPSLHNFGGLLLDQTNLYRLISYQVIRPDLPRTFEECIVKVTSRSCKVEADRIYSILGFVNDGPDIRPNYSLPPHKVFRNVTLELCKLRRNLDILSHIYHWDESTLQPTEWPTWVPRWNKSNPTRIDHLAICAAAGPLRFFPPRLSNDESEIEVRGIYLNITTVVRNFDIVDLQTNGETVSVPERVRQVWEAWTALIGNEPAKRRNKRIIHDFVWTLLCGSPDYGLGEVKEWAKRQIYQDFAAWWADTLFSQVILGVPDASHFVSTRIAPAGMAALMYRRGQEPSLDDCSYLKSWEAFIHEYMNSAEYDRDVSDVKRIILDKITSSYGLPTSEIVADAVACFFPDSQHSNFRKEWTHSGISRSFFILKGGYIGMGPRIMRDCDVVAILAGSSVPYVLRPLGDHYIFIGDCYVHGIMQGELARELESSGLLESCTESFRIR